MKLIKQSKKNDIKVFEHFVKNEGTYYTVTNFNNTKFIEKLSCNNLKDINKYMQ